MLTLPRKLTRPKMGLRSPLQKIWPRHRRWVKSHGCCVPECQASRVDFAHLRSAANAGMAQKPHDMFGISLCRDHHGEQHSLGIDAFGANTASTSGRSPPSSPDRAPIRKCALRSASCAQSKSEPLRTRMPSFMDIYGSSHSRLLDPNCEKRR